MGKACALRQRNRRPLGLPCPAAFVAAPSRVRPVDGDHRHRRELVDEVIPRGYLVRLMLPLGLRRAGAVEPDLVYGPVLGQQLEKLAEEIRVVVVHVVVEGAGVLERPIRRQRDRLPADLRAVAVPPAVANGLDHVGRRKIHAELEVVLFARGRQVGHHVALAGPPRAACDAVGGVSAGPEAEPVVMLDGERDHRHAGRLRREDPLLAVEGGRVEDVGVFLARPPVKVRKRVGTEVYEARELPPLPGELSRAWTAGNGIGDPGGPISADGGPGRDGDGRHDGKADQPRTLCHHAKFPIEGFRSPGKSCHAPANVSTSFPCQSGVTSYRLKASNGLATTESRRHVYESHGRKISRCCGRGRRGGAGAGRGGMRRQHHRAQPFAGSDRPGRRDVRRDDRRTRGAHPPPAGSAADSRAGRLRRQARPADRLPHSDDGRPADRVLG